jgi:hypothetical protein
MWHYVIITGATKGFGKAVALRIAKVISSPVWFSISGRNSKELEETKNAILNISCFLNEDILFTCIIFTCNVVFHYSINTKELEKILIVTSL